MKAIFQKGGWRTLVCLFWVLGTMPLGAQPASPEQTTPEQTPAPGEPPAGVRPPRAIPVQPGTPAETPERIPLQVPAAVEPAQPPGEEPPLPSTQVLAEPELPPPAVPGMDGMPSDPLRPILLDIVAPQPREIVAEQTVDVFFQLENYVLGPADSGGNRLHVILDNGPPQPVYDAVRPLTFKELSQGGHTVRVLVVRPDGTWIEGERTFAMRHFYVGRKDFQNYADGKSPFLTVNLPGQGQVESDEDDRLAFDYIMHNARPEDGYQVRYSISGYEGFLQERGPVYWRNILPGKHRLVVEFFDGKGQPVFGPFNRVERVFELRKVLKALPVVPETAPAPEFPSE